MLAYSTAGVRLDPQATASQQQLWASLALAVDRPDAEHLDWSTVLDWLDNALDPDAVRLARELHSRLGLPEIGRAHVHLDNEAPMGRGGFRLTAELREGQTRLTYTTQTPAYTDRMGRQRLVDSFSWRLLRAANKTPPATNDANEQYLWWGQVRQLAESAGATMSTYLRRQNIAVLDEPRLELEETEDGQAIVARVSGNNISPEDTDTIFETWGPRAANASVHTLPSKDGRKRIVTTERGRAALQAVSEKRVFRGAAAATLAENPESIFDPELFDLSAYSDRVIAIGPPRYRATVTVKTDDDDARDWRSGLTETLLLNLDNPAQPELPPIQLDLTEPEARDDARAAVREAMAKEEDFAEIQGHQVRVDPELAATLGDVQSRRPVTAEAPVARPTELDGKVLQIKENTDNLEHGQVVRTTEVPDDFRPSLPAGLASWVELRQHQHEGVAKVSWWTDASSDPLNGGLLADDMGLGKTLQILVVLAMLAERNALRPSLVVAPVALLENWRREAARFVPDAITDVAFLQDIPRGHEHLAKDYDLVLTSYESLVRRDLEMGRIDWQVVVCDEAQKIKNSSTRAAHAVKAMKCRYRLAMTGTPVENSLDELWSITDFFQPGLLGSLRDFRATYSSREVLADEALRDQAATNLTRLLEPVVVRRMKHDVAKDLPPIHIHTDEVPLSELQTKLYRVVHQDMAEGNILGTIQRLLQVCAHPGMVGEAGTTLPCPKLDWTLARLDTIRAKGEKALVFVRFRKLQEILKTAFDERYGLNVRLLDGTVPPRQRQPIVDAFGARDGFDILILSPRSCGVGLNITAANHVVHYTREWNPAIEAQATDRAYRIGQTRPVHVWIPVATSPSFQTAETTLAAILASKESLRGDFIRPSKSLGITLADWNAGLEATPIEGGPSMVDSVSDSRLAEACAQRSTHRSPDIETTPWGASATTPDQTWLVVSDTKRFLTTAPSSEPEKTKVVLRAPLGLFGFRQRSQLSGRGTLVEVDALPELLDGLHLSEGQLLLEDAPSSPDPAAVPSQRGLGAIDVPAVLAEHHVSDVSLNAREQELLAALLHLPSPISAGTLAQHVDRPTGRTLQAVRSLNKSLHRKQVALRITVTKDADPVIDIR
jgi:hypothetical protein